MHSHDVGTDRPARRGAARAGPAVPLVPVHLVPVSIATGSFFAGRDAACGIRANDDAGCTGLGRRGNLRRSWFATIDRHEAADLEDARRATNVW